MRTFVHSDVGIDHYFLRRGDGGGGTSRQFFFFKVKHRTWSAESTFSITAPVARFFLSALLAAHDFFFWGGGGMEGAEIAQPPDPSQKLMVRPVE